VWRVLSDFGSYPEWNPFIRSIEGDARKGGKLTVRIEPPERKAMTFKPTVLTAEPNRELRWIGHVLIPGLFDGEHTLRVEPIDERRSRFIQAERFKGILVPLFKSALDKTEVGFEQMNAALEKRAEAAAAEER
jgi:hypothetical protein